MPDSHIESLKDFRLILFNRIKNDPISLRYIFHIKSGFQKSRKRIVQLMRTGMSSEIFAVIHPDLQKELQLFDQLMTNNFNINIWEFLNIDDDSSKSNYLLLLWSGMNAKIQDPIELISLLFKSTLINLDNALIHKIHSHNINSFSISENILWKELTVHIPELKQLPADDKRILKSSKILNDAAKSRNHVEDIINPQDGITVYNAGLILLWPFLSRFFSKLELSNSNGFFGDSERARAIQLTQFLVTGSNKMEEWNLALNKILCGADLNLPIDPIFDITLEEEGLSEKMLKGALQNWPKLKNTKTETFQETFLRRQGRLYKRENYWELNVEKKAYDMLLSSLPWNISMIKLNWMNDRLVVEWN